MAYYGIALGIYSVRELSFSNNCLLMKSKVGFSEVNVLLFSVLVMSYSILPQNSSVNTRAKIDSVNV